MRAVVKTITTITETENVRLVLLWLLMHSSCTDANGAEQQSHRAQDLEKGIQRRRGSCDSRRMRRTKRLGRRMLACLVVVVVESGEEWRDWRHRTAGGRALGRWRQTRLGWTGLVQVAWPVPGGVFGLQAAWNRRGGYDGGASLAGGGLRLREGCEQADRRLEVVMPLQRTEMRPVGPYGGISHCTAMTLAGNKWMAGKNMPGPW